MATIVVLAAEDCRVCRLNRRKKRCRRVADMSTPQSQSLGPGAPSRDSKRDMGFEHPTWNPADHDPTPGTKGPRYLTAEDRARFREVLLPIADALDRATMESTREPVPGTDAWRIWRSGEKRHALEAMITMRYSNMSAIDHVRAYVALVKEEATGASALATVARGAHEALARTSFLLARSDDADLYHRSISLLIAELYFPIKFDESMRTRGGVAVDPAEEREELEAELRRLGLPKSSRIDFATMVASMLDDAIEGSGGRDAYSTLSAVAHAQRYGLDPYIRTDERGQVVGLVAPRAVVFQQVFELMATLSTTALAYVTFFAQGAEASIPLREAEVRAMALLETLAAEMWPTD